MHDNMILVQIQVSSCQRNGLNLVCGLLEA